MVKPGRRWVGSINWSSVYGGEHRSSAGLESDLDADGVGRLTIRCRINDEPMEQVIPVIARPMRFGGIRLYLRCPSGRTASKLYLPPGARKFASRAAYGLAYASQQGDAHDRALSQAQAIRLKVGGPNWVSIDDFFPPKPKRMRWATYRRLEAEAERCEAICSGWLVQRYGLLGR